jgi:GntR family transcriptional regulator, rspAB operon transcriptional repressor
MLLPAALSPQGPRDGARLTPLDALDGSLGQRVYLTLRQAILSLALTPGEMLKKPDICAELGVSRFPVGEAILRLAGEGLVDIQPQAGSFVARIRMTDIREGAFLREAIEVAAIARVAAMVTDDQVAALAQVIDAQAALVAAGDVAGFYAQDGAMHELLLGFTGFPRLAQVADTAWVHVNRARRLMLPVPGRVAQTLDEHRAILAALAGRDPAAAQMAVQHHLRQLVTHLEPLEQARPELFA